MDPDYDVFDAIVAGGSLSAAARAMHLSPAMVSKRLARLEERLGVRLFHRTTRKLALTDAGERFHHDVAAILQAVRDAESRLIGARSEPAGTVRMSAPTSFGRLHVAPKLHAFLAHYPRVRLELDLSDDTVDLYGGRYDLAIRIATTIPPNQVGHRLGGSRRLLCASPLYLERHGPPATIEALAQHHLLAAAGQMPWRLVKGRRRFTVEGESHVRTNSSEVIRELAITGVGIALRSLWDVEQALASGALVPVLAGWEGPDDLAVHAVYPRGPSTPPAITALVAFLQETLADASWDAVRPRP
ncbi:LysR family transcriptional regulator [Sphingomonas sp. PsM26]|nr:LysR family transcriptional regulator [Sphingomonas sp. PsM26]